VISGVNYQPANISLASRMLNVMLLGAGKPWGSIIIVSDDTLAYNYNWR